MATKGNSNSSEENKPVLYIKTYGCQMNVRDSEVICGLLTANGYRLTTKPEEAEVIIFNTCSVRQHAEDKVWSEIGRVANLCDNVAPPKFANANLSRVDTRPKKRIVGLVGCMAQNYKEKVFERAPNVDFAVGPQDLHKIPEIIKELCKNGDSKNGDSPQKAGTVPIFSPFFLRKIWETDGKIRPDQIYHTNFHQDKEHAYIVISEGCSNYCSYCVVPYVRGELRNRKAEDILREIKEAVDRGISKITLLGQNVCAYGAENREQRIENREAIDFIRLLETANKIKGLKEFDFVTSHPRDTSLELFKAMADLEKLKKYLHLPVQSGSDRILKLMNRGYARNFYLDLADNYRKIVKGGILSTDIIVGFPTETEEDFHQTHNLVKDIQFEAAYIFKYSPRPHTQAANLPDDVEKKEKERRHGMILDLQKEISRKKK